MDVFGTENHVQHDFCIKMRDIKIIIIPRQKNKEGYCSIYFELTTYDGGKRVRRRVSSAVKVKPSNWSKVKSKVLKSDPSATLKNKLLDNKYQELLLVPSSTKEKEVKEYSELLDYLDRFIQLRVMLGCKRTSYKEFITIKNRMERFEEFRLSQGFKRLRFNDLTLRFSDDLILWMSSCKYDPNTIKKHFITLKTFVNHYYNRASEYPEIEFTNDYLKSEFGKVSTHSSPPLPLSDKEFVVLCNCEHLLIAKPSLTKVKDAFLFACVTGLRYSDLFNVSEANIRENLIIVSPSKTENTKRDNLCRIPLNHISKEILNKYGGSTASLKLSNQVYNRRLKELFNLLKFNQITEVKEYSGLGSPLVKNLPKHQLLSSHNARDTFITMCIKRGVSIPVIMEMTGHTKYETMKKYIKLDDNHLFESMSRF
ncbi:tyrosine-type recombinase/integrase [uncultured Roseivirga sp.]|uniref:site-specific integrase n=1 Tax=uncultured Roseivirga sp. TaxID=543088 RepID=UPI0030DAB21E|tara:strand:+ start:93261 stop:94535 length:1275 start_codon:yes stop_codon:yes gene_type:complete